MTQIILFFKKQPNKEIEPVDVFEHLLKYFEEVGELIETELWVHCLRQKGRHDAGGHQTDGQALLLIGYHPPVDTCDTIVEFINQHLRSPHIHWSIETLE